MTDIVDKASEMAALIQMHSAKDNYWSARELWSVLGYNSWRSFDRQIKQVKTACEQSGLEVADHVKDTIRTTATSTRNQRKLKDYLLSSYACFLVASNSDGRKPEVAKAQLYFSKASRESAIASNTDNL